MRDAKTEIANKSNLSGSLNVGQVFDANLCDIRGGLLLPAGKPVTESLVRSLASRGIREVFLDDGRIRSANAEDLKLVAPYDPVAQQRLEDNHQRIASVLSDFSQQIHSGHSTSTDELEEIVAEYLRATLQDAGVVLASCMSLADQTSYESDEALIRRSTRMAMLATVTAAQLDLSENDCMAAGLISTIHDMSLFGTEYWKVDQAYLDHPLRSIDLLRNTFGLTDQMRMIVGQVHEQCDGSGFPRKLKSVRLHKVSRLLNLVDAYLTLTEPTGARTQGYAPSDALAYLAQQSIYGCFDRDCVRALIAAASIYPVGTKVLLSDGRIAMVLRSTGPTYLQPIVVIDSNPEKVLDLRTSELYIECPEASNFASRRIPKTALNEVLWRPAA